MAGAAPLRNLQRCPVTGVALGYLQQHWPITKRLVQLSRPTWPVGADLLFERVRSVNYMVLATSITLLNWLFQLLLTTRTQLGSTSWDWHAQFNVKPLYWLVYADCGAASADTTMDSFFGKKPCNESVQTGFVWEILFAALQFLLDMVLLQMVNNPWRSKRWGVPAFAVIVFNIVDFGKLVFFNDIDTPGGEFDVLIKARSMMFGIYTLCWVVLLVLLFDVLRSANFNRERGLESLEYTRRLLRSKASTDAPARFQQYAEALKPVCEQEDLASCARAAVRNMELREEARRIQSEASSAESQQGLRGWLEMLLGRRGASPDDERESNESSGRGRGVSNGLKSLDRLPSLAQVSLVLSALMVFFVGVYVIYLASESKRVFTTTGRTVNTTANGVEQASEATVLSVQSDARRRPRTSG